MPKPLTRFVVRTDGTRRELLKVKEATNGALTIMPKSSEFLLTRPKDRLRITSQHFSVHNSPASESNTIHYTRVRSDGSQEEAHFYTQAMKKNNLFSLLFSRTVPNLNLPHFALAAPDRDRIVPLGEYDCQKSTLVYSVVVSRVGQEIRGSIFGEQVVSRDFARYRLSIILSQLNMASPPESASIVAASFPLDAPKGSDPIRPPSQGTDVYDTQVAHWGAVNTMREILIGYIRETALTEVPEANRIRPEGQVPHA